MNTLQLVREAPGERWWRFRDDGTRLEKPPRDQRIEVDSIVISDVHFSFVACKARALLAMLNTFWIQRRLILNGDLFESSRPTGLTEAQRQALNRIVKFRDPESDHHIEDIWVEGNHDYALIQNLSAVLGLTTCEEFEFECGGKKYLIVHGDRWDHFVSKRPKLTRAISSLHGLVQKLDPHNRHLVRWIAKQAGEWNRERDSVAEGAIAYAVTKGADYVIAGHVHHAERRTKYGIGYLNDGCWTQDDCAFVTITEAGPVLNHLQLV